MEDMLMDEKEQEELLSERYALALERIREIPQEAVCAEAFQKYFHKMAEFVSLMNRTWNVVECHELEQMTLAQLQAQNHELYEDILPEHYDTSYGNPDYAVNCLGESMGPMLCFLYAELRGMIPAAFEADRFGMVIRMELLLEVYQAFVCAAQDLGPRKEAIRHILYWYVSDYYEPEAVRHTARMLCPDRGFARRIVMESDLSDLRYLYYYGEYVTENELETARHLNSMPAEKIKLMADTYTEGYRIGFEVGNKDISIKKTVNIRYFLGFERMIRKAVENFDQIGLQPTFYRAGSNIFQGRSVNKNGWCGANPNKQFDYDHKEDQALVLDGALVERRLEGLRKAFEQWKAQAAVFGGPAVLEIFGEKPFVPKTKKNACRLSEKQQKLAVEYAGKAGALQNEYIKGEERSFTIIAFPVPDIGERFEEIFDETIRINTLDYDLYRDIQQKIIDTLDEAVYCIIKGMGANRTNMKVMLHRLTDKAHQTNFENCVADVNIPVGEVFTSPQLSGTEGTLHVTKVFLNELRYENLELIFRDGMVTDYRCTNFETEEENKKLVKDTVLFHHDSLPLGEFAIGTNTTAYMAAKRLQIEEKLPILIAEKMGPHFAVGDTCYSHAEDVAVYNPDGKEIIARDNERSLVRKEHPEQAYFNCHTDITIPYDELGEVSAVREDGSVVVIIEEGRFVLPGCEALNEPLLSGQ